MRFVLCSLVLLVAPLAAWAAPPKLAIPSPLKATDGYVVLVPDSDAVSITYISLDGLTPFPNMYLKDAKSLIVPVKGEKPGTYRFIAVAASKEGDQIRVDFVVVIEGPPVPPSPPPPPTPEQAFAQALKDAYASETSTNKAALLDTLTSLYRAAITSTVPDASVKTVGDLFSDLKTASVTLLPVDALPAVRKVIGSRLADSLGTNAGAVLDKSLATKELNAIVIALGGVK